METFGAIMTLLNQHGANIVSRLSKHPDLQLKYLDNLLQEEKKGKRKVGLSQKILFVRLVLDHSPESICQCLEAYSLPLDDSLKICEEKRSHLGSAYIRFRLGMKDKAIGDYGTVRNFNPKI